MNNLNSSTTPTLEQKTAPNGAGGQAATFDAFIPPEMATKAEAIGVKKATMGWRNTFFLSVMAGAFIAFGAIFATTVITGAGGQLTFGVTKLLAGLVFCLGLILVIALLTLPAAVSALFSRSPARMMLFAILFGACFTLLGLLLSHGANIPSGASIIVVAGIGYLVALGVKSSLVRMSF